MSVKQPKTYWMSLPERDGDAEHLAASGDEFRAVPERGGLDLSRRGFLKAAGFAFVGAALNGCQRTPEHKAIPYLVQPEAITPGRSLFYASTCGGCSSGCGLLVKDRDGRPIKLEGNPEHSLSHGGLCAVGQASILGLYDRLRLRHPLRDGRDSTWEEVDREILTRLDNIRKQGGAVRFLTSTILSPTLRAAIGRFLEIFPDGRHIIYDAASCSAILDAHALTHGARVLPRHRLDRAEVLVAFDADFLGTWISPVEFAAAYHRGRPLDESAPRLSYHVQFESRLSLTGSKADQRVRIAPGEAGLILTHLAARIAAKAGTTLETDGLEESPISSGLLDRLTTLLWHTRGRSLVLCGSQDVKAQLLCNFINHHLCNYGATLDVEHPSYQRQGDDRRMQTLLQELHDGRVAALFVYKANPIYDLPGSEELANALGRVPLVVSCAERLDETARRAQFVCPDHHYLESWLDAEPVSGLVSLIQPALSPLGQTRSILESVAAWSRTPKSAYDQLRQGWQTQVFPRQDKAKDFQTFWDRAVHDGHAQVQSGKMSVHTFDGKAVRSVLTTERPPEETFALVLYPKVGMPDGSHAYNPWLHELPDPISKVTWDNYACLSPAAAKRLGLADGDVVRVEVSDSGGKQMLELPVFQQPGQHDQALAVALGYGARVSERFEQVGPEWLEGRGTLGENGLVGVNAAPLLSWTKDGNLRYAGVVVRLTRTAKRHALASTQTYHRLKMPDHLAPPDAGQRPIIHDMTLAEFQGHRPKRESAHGRKSLDLWPPDHPISGAHWGMVIDLNACTGCSACVVACQVENNIPVVGKDEVLREREMHWLRIDRYYSGDGGDVDVAHQPMLCQHCENAPCETVCPVLATVHSEEGLNQQIYNRCVGTRYCANNCPYKVRRFNWFNYAHKDALQNLVLNPDVTVRSRGVMEKCTFCVQRIQGGKIAAGGNGTLPADGVIQTACQQSCPTQAIVFGDLNDPNSMASRLLRSRRRYQVLEELNVRPSVNYLSLVRNRPASAEEEHRG
jgi:molybdopterin-containing oxidoreductase family iron-sulfur binding subunit